MFHVLQICVWAKSPFVREPRHPTLQPFLASSIPSHMFPTAEPQMQGLSEYHFLALMGYGYAAFDRRRIRMILIPQNEDENMTSPSRINKWNIFRFGYYCGIRI